MDGERPILRFWTACLALILAPLAAADGKELKPKFGDIGGVFYTEVSEDREACRQAIGNKIALCRQNTSFVSNTLDRKYPGCLPIFRQQSEVCAAHFRREAVNCEIQGSARIADFTGFSCEVTATVVEEGGEPERTPGIAPADRPMQARTRTNMRSGPGTDHAKVGLLEAGEEVRVTGEAGEWLRFEASGGSTAFVYGSLLVERGVPRDPKPKATRDRTHRRKPIGGEPPQKLKRGAAKERLLRRRAMQLGLVINPPKKAKTLDSWWNWPIPLRHVTSCSTRALMGT